MKLKLDENLGPGAQGLFHEAGHEVETVFSEGLSGAPDEAIFARCCEENLCLVSMDLDFSDPVRFSSRRCGGIVILRGRKPITDSSREIVIRQCLHGLKTMPLNKDLWIVEPSRIRIHQREDG